MNNKLIKNFIMLILIFVLLINNFATFAFDNSGSAFITKAEFDALKSSFQAQIDTYNQNIDSKIDNAIVSYLSGIKVSSEVTRAKYCNPPTWTFMHSNNYPKYKEGAPYIHGYSFGGNNMKNGTTRNVTWAGVEYIGKSAYKTNGGFQKHFVDKIGYGSLNGIGTFVAEYNGYWINEGEEIAIGGTNVHDDNGSYALAGEKYCSFETPVVYSDAVTPKKISSMQLWDGGVHDYCTQFDLIVQTAARLVGDQSQGNNVSIYNDINDDRFWDVNVVNRIGITSTTPEITRTKKLKSTSTTYDGYTWWTDVVPTISAKYAAIYLTGGSGNTNYTGVQGQDMWSYNEAWAGFKSSEKTVYLPKLANDPNGLQFKYLWSPYTASAAVAVQKLYDDTTSLTEKVAIKKAIIYDDDGIVHLSLGAGYPLISVEKDEEVTWEVSVPSSVTTDIDLVGKYIPFDPVTDAKSQADIEFTNGSSTNKKIFEIKKVDGVNTIKFKASKDGIVFFKWAEHGFGNGTTLDVSRDPKVKLVAK